MGVRIGAKYQYAKHPDKPIGTATGYDFSSSYVTIEWDNKNLIPPVDDYPEEYFSDGTFLAVDEMSVQGGDPACWYHDWAHYKGFTEEYEYCKRCDAKRFNNG